MRVGLVLVSHSAAIADGTAQLASQMAPGVAIVAAGGADDGGLGTSFDRISEALEQAESGRGVVILYDLGSALLTTETAIEFADPEVAARWRLVDAPLVEGAVAAAVAAEGGADLDAVAAAAGEAADAAGDAEGSSGPGAATGDPHSGEPPIADPGESVEVRIVNPLGLHARPAAELARALAGTSATVRIGRDDGVGVDLRSVLAVVGLALRGGDRARLRAWGPDAAAVLHRLSELIRHGFGEAGPPRSLPQQAAVPAELQDGTVHATAGADGMAIGPLVRLGALPDELPDDADPGSAGSPEDQAERLDVAIAIGAKHLAGKGVFGQAHAALVADPALRAAASAALEQGAARAWWGAVTSAAAGLLASPDELIAARGIDLKEAGLAVLAELGVQVQRIGPAVRGGIVHATELGPAEVPALVRHGAAAVVLSGSSATAHAVIVAGGLGLPLVVRTGNLLDAIPDGTRVLVDGTAGTVRIDPGPDEAARAERAIAEQLATAAGLRAAASEPVVLADGRRVLVAANIGSVTDARAAVDNGADAVGLLRTELLIMDRAVVPDEDTQTTDLAEILEVLGDRPTVIRVLDTGGDKPMRSLGITPDTNGFLGIRGLRFLLANSEVLHTQLRAICRAGVGRRVSVMAPMVTTRAEAQAFRDAVDSAVASLAEQGVPHAAPEQVGIMVEVPAAALDPAQFVGVVDFFSVGSNDLTSYTMAAARTEPGVADLLQPGSPAVQQLIDRLCAVAAEHGVPVAVCGEIAGMAEHAPGLVQRGVMELSMAPARIPQIKALLRGQVQPGPAGPGEAS